MKTFFYLVFFVLLIHGFVFSQGYWQRSDLFGGDVRALIATRNGTVLAGTYGSGIYYSTDDGTNWNQTTPFEEEVVYSFVLHPVNDGDVFAGTNSRWSSPRFLDRELSQRSLLFECHR